jgi:hypothetical protein
MAGESRERGALAHLKKKIHGSFEPHIIGKYPSFDTLKLSDRAF